MSELSMEIVSTTVGLGVLVRLDDFFSEKTEGTHTKAMTNTASSRIHGLYFIMLLSNDFDN